MSFPEERRKLAQQLRDDAALIAARLEQDGEAIAQRMRHAADLLDHRAEEGISPSGTLIPDSRPGVPDAGSLAPRSSRGRALK